MKWKSDTYKPRRVVFKVNPAHSGGKYDLKSTLELQMAPDTFHIIRDRRPRPRPQPKTMPWIVGAVIWLWLALEGEL